MMFKHVCRRKWVVVVVFYILHLQLVFGSCLCSGWLLPGHRLLDLELVLLNKDLC